MILRELVAIDAVRQLAQRSRQRQHRRLNEVVTRGVVVDPAQLFGMDQVLGIVDHHDVETLAAAFFEQQQVLIDPVQAIGLGGRAGMRAQRQMDLRKPPGDRPDRLLGFDVVGIAAREDVIVGITDRSQVVFEHPSDHLVLLPQGHEDGDPLARGIFQLAGTGREQARGRAQRGLEPGPGPGQIHHQVVQAADQNRGRQGRQDRQHPAVDTGIDRGISHHLSRVARAPPLLSARGDFTRGDSGVPFPIPAPAPCGSPL